jgi:hypothetical protein
MPRNAVDMTGQRFGRLVVQRRAGSAPNGRATWRCRCDCGQEHTVRGDVLRQGMTSSCGCIGAEVRAITAAATGRRNRTHGHSTGGTNTPEYQTWASMLRRCYTPSATSFKWYGALGVKVCDRWRTSFEDFLTDMGARPSPTHSIDRINPSGDYEPGNCRWATSQQQNFNKRSHAQRSN